MIFLKILFCVKTLVGWGETVGFIRFPGLSHKLFDERLGFMWVVAVRNRIKKERSSTSLLFEDWWKSLILFSPPQRNREIDYSGASISVVSGTATVSTGASSIVSVCGSGSGAGSSFFAQPLRNISGTVKQRTRINTSKNRFITFSPPLTFSGCVF